MVADANRDDTEEPRFVRCLGCGEPLHNQESQELGAGPACRIRLGDTELARRRARVLSSARTATWISLTSSPRQGR